MKARPILFSGDMIRALLDDNKTQTRRVIKADYHDLAERDDGSLWPWREDLNEGGDIWYTCPHGQPGDLLWVRETFITGVEFDDNQMPTENQRTWYRADGDLDYWYNGESDFPQDNIPWKPSIHMPRWASRLTLRITSVRVERLKDISMDDALEEGASQQLYSKLGFSTNGASQEEFNLTMARNCFKGLWKSINGADSWDANPWVWVIEFEVIKANVDQVLKEADDAA